MSLIVTPSTQEIEAFNQLWAEHRRVGGELFKECLALRDVLSLYGLSGQIVQDFMERYSQHQKALLDEKLARAVMDLRDRFKGKSE